MSVVDGAMRSVGKTVGLAANATTAAAGAVGGAAVDGVLGGVSGAAAGAQRGLGKGSRSVPAAALTLGAIGAVGLVEWPVLLAVGGGALMLRQLGRRQNGAAGPSAHRAKKAGTTTTRSVKSGPRGTTSAERTRASRGTRSRSRR